VQARQADEIDEDYGVEQFQQDEEQPELHKSPSKTQKGPFPDESSESANAENKIERASKGFSIAGAVSAQRKDNWNR
jgi:hypothetical protein